MPGKSNTLRGILMMFAKSQASRRASVDQTGSRNVPRVDLDEALGPPKDAQATREWIEHVTRYYLGPDVDRELMDDLEAKNLTNQQVENALLARADQKLSGSLISRYDRHRRNQMMVYIPVAKLVFCPIGKVANTAVKAWATELAGRSFESDGDIHREINARKVPLTVEAWTRWRFDKIRHDPAWAFVALVRDPAERLVSAYWDKFVIHRTPSETLQHTRDVLEYVYETRDLQTADIERGVSFRQFCQYLDAKPPQTLDGHWAPQHQDLESFRWDRLFDLDRVEDFERFVRRRCRRGYREVPLGIRNSVPKDAESTSRVEPLADALPNELLSVSIKRPSVNAFLTPDIKTFISDYYAMDEVLLSAARRGHGRAAQINRAMRKLRRLI